MDRPEGFISLTDALRPVAPAPQTSVERDPPEREPAPAAEEIDRLREARLFYARLAEAVEAAVDTVLADIACDVVGRELQLAAPQLQEIVARALQQYAEGEPLRVRLHPDDASETTCDLPIVRDASLRRGDAILELREGSIDATLGVRLESILSRAA